MDSCPVCDPPLALGDGRTLVVRHLAPTDAAGLRALYDRLETDDLRRRFFTGGRPPDSFIESWTRVAEAGGLALAVDIIDGEEVDLVAEAGYALQDDGDGELGITVDRGHRGWLGPWLLNSLLNHANDRGVENLQAVVLGDNRAMLALATKRGFVIRGHPDWGKIRISMATRGHLPSWGPHRERPRVVVETNRSRWRAEDDFERAGFDIALCLGPCGSLEGCPVLTGEPCPLLAGTDAVVVDLAPDESTTRSLVAAEQAIHPGIRLVAGMTVGTDGTSRRRSGDELLAELDDLIDRGSST